MQVRCRRTFDRVSFGDRRFPSSWLVTASEFSATTVSGGTTVSDGVCDCTCFAGDDCGHDVARRRLLQAMLMQVVAFTHLHERNVAGLPFHLAT